MLAKIPLLDVSVADQVQAPCECTPWEATDDGQEAGFQSAVGEIWLCGSWLWQSSAKAGVGIWRTSSK